WRTTTKRIEILKPLYPCPQDAVKRGITEILKIKMEKQKNAVGRRKEAVTRVFLSKGDGKITANGKDYKTYFSLVYLQNQVEAPLKTVESSDKFDVVVNATGGGVKGQAEAAKLGIARALLEVSG